MLLLGKDNLVKASKLVNEILPGSSAGMFNFKVLDISWVLNDKFANLIKAFWIAITLLETLLLFEFTIDDTNADK